MTRTARAYDVYGRECVGVNLRDVPELLHIGKMPRGHRAGKRLNLACPYGRNPCMTRRKEPSADTVKQTAEGHHRTSLKQ
nr:hypothetical protein [Selenomonas noxia]